MFKLILIAGGALALATSPAYAGGKPSLTRQVLQCLGCPGAGTLGSGNAIVTGNLNVTKHVRAGNAAVSGAAAASLQAAARVQKHGKNVSAMVNARARANLSASKRGADCK